MARSNVHGNQLLTLTSRCFVDGVSLSQTRRFSLPDTFVSIRRYHVVTEGESAHNEESRQEPYRTNNRFESCTKDGILLMGSQALTVDRASFLRSSILFPPPAAQIRGPGSRSDSRYTRKATRQTSNSCTGDKSNAITRPPRELLRECL